MSAACSNEGVALVLVVRRQRRIGGWTSRGRRRGDWATPSATPHLDLIARRCPPQDSFHDRFRVRQRRRQFPRLEMEAMWKQPENDQFVDELYLAGERVPPGTYRQVGGGREVRLEQPDYLPASLDGRVACYTRVANTWGQISRQGQAA